MSRSCAEFGAPDLAGPAEQLADPDVIPLSGDAAELASGWIETQQCAGSEVAHPHDVVLIDVHSVGLRPVAGQTPGLPSVLRGVETSKLAREEFADPQCTGRV